MNVAIFLGHPAHFHLFKNVAENLKNKGHNVSFVIKQKDILCQLLDEAELSYCTIREGRSNSKWGMIKSVCTMELGMVRFLWKNHIDILIGSTLSFATRFFSKAKVFAVGEDDAQVVPAYANLVYPFADEIITPIVCDNGKFNDKSVKYAGYHKLAYLHPNRFTPQKKIVEQYFSTESPYFLIRFAQLKAHHDVGIHGINTEIAQHLIDILKPYGRIYITSERELEPQFECYRLKINPLDIHHVMAFASLYIGDSQSMAVEAAMLGTPSLRFNDFAGRIGVLEELEHKYGLTFGIKTSNPQQLYDKIEELLHLPDLKAEFQRRRAKMLSEKIDVTAFFTWFIENYPQSAQIMKENPDYQYNFK